MLADILRRRLTLEDSVENIRLAHYAAEEKHPQFATTLAGAVSILTEEVGEVAMAVNDHCAFGEPLEEVREELYQVGAVVLRMLDNLDTLEARL